jgi:uncharacterized membrane protein
VSESNPNSRLEAFCDGVFAIALTLLIIEVKIPPTVEIHNTADFWIALRNIAPSIYAFLLSFIIILIVWVNHHAGLKMAGKSSPRFSYANGVLLLAVVFIPFPTSLLGEHLFTDHAAPAVMLYNFSLALQAIGWILIGGTSLKEKLYKNEKFIPSIRQNLKYAWFAFTFYTLCAIAALWYPLTAAVITTASWVFWLIVGINLNHD